MKERASTTIRLGSVLDAEVDKLADELDMPRSQVVRKAVKQFVARQKHISELLAEARERHATYKRDGLGVPWSEVSSWLLEGAPEEERPAVRDMRG